MRGSGRDARRRRAGPRSNPHRRLARKGSQGGAYGEQSLRHHAVGRVGSETRRRRRNYLYPRHHPRRRDSGAAVRGRGGTQQTHTEPASRQVRRRRHAQPRGQGDRVLGQNAVRGMDGVGAPDHGRGAARMRLADSKHGRAQSGRNRLLARPLRTRIRLHHPRGRIGEDARGPRLGIHRFRGQQDRYKSPLPPQPRGVAEDTRHDRHHTQRRRHPHRGRDHRGLRLARRPLCRERTSGERSYRSPAQLCARTLHLRSVDHAVVVGSRELGRPAQIRRRLGSGRQKRHTGRNRRREPIPSNTDSCSTTYIPRSATPTTRWSTWYAPTPTSRRSRP